MDSKDSHFLEKSLSDFPVMIWKWDLIGNTFQSTANIANFLRKNGPANVLSMKDFMERIHPDDRQGLIRLRKEIQTHRIETFSMTYRILDEKENWRWVLTQGQATAWGGQGNAIEATGITIDQTPLKETEKITRQTERKLTSFFDTLDDLIFACEPQGTLLKANTPSLARELFGEDRLEGQKLDDLLRARGASEEAISHLLSEDPPLFTASLTDQRGQLRFLEIKTTQGTWEGRPAFFGRCHDFSERKKAQMELHLRREQLELALEGAQEGLWDSSLLSGEITFDDRSLLLLGQPHGNVIHFDRDMDYVHPDDISRFKEILREHLRGDTPLFSAEYRVILPAGGIRWIFQRGRICGRDAQGNPTRMRGTLMDISQHKKDDEARIALQKKLAESEERLKLALEATREGLWDWDIKNDAVFVSDHWLETLDYTSEDIPNSAMIIFELMHPEDKEKVQKKLQDHLEGNIPFYDAEFRALTKNGEWKWLRSRGKVVSRNDDGSPLRMVGTQTDISLQITRQKKIEELEARLQEASSRDNLTGVLNRQEFRRILNREADRALRHSSPLSLILIDFDRFNLINSQYGHQTGDRLLVEASRLISQEIRASDTLARWSGEEFIIITPEKLRGSLALAEKLRGTLVNSSFPDLPNISARLGVASYRAGEKLEDLLQRVDIALYKAKKHQSNRIAFQE